LFGERTGGEADSSGCFAAADGGTLFLDALGDLPAVVQSGLLRAIEARAVVPVGAGEPVPCDVRVVCATSLDLDRAVRLGRFREDLRARLAEVVLTLPPVRERREDILPLLRSCLESEKPLEPELANELLLHPWPFNVREIQKLAVELDRSAENSEMLELAPVLRRLRAFGGTAMLRVESNEVIEGAPDPVGYIDPPPAARSKAPSRSELEFALREHGGVVADVARAMGRPRGQVSHWITKYEMDLASFR